jgi:hypothetical protein
MSTGVHTRLLEPSKDDENAVPTMAKVGMDSPVIFLPPKGVSNQSISKAAMYSTKQCIVADWTRPGGRGNGVNASVIHFRLRLRHCVLSTGFRAGPENWSPGRYPQRRPHTSAPDKDFESRTRPGHSPANPRRRVKVESARLVEWSSVRSPTALSAASRSSFRRLDLSWCGARGRNPKTGSRCRSRGEELWSSRRPTR